MLPVGTVAAISQGGPSPSSAAIVAAPTGVRERRSGDAVSIPESSEQRTSTDVVEAVSYPHLDVYKRQGIACQADLRHPNPIYKATQTNTRWVWTQANDGTWDWFPQTAISQGAAGLPINGIARCQIQP